MVVMHKIPNEVADFHCCLPEKREHFALTHIDPQHTQGDVDHKIWSKRD